MFSLMTELFIISRDRRAIALFYVFLTVFFKVMNLDFEGTY